MTYKTIYYYYLLLLLLLLSIIFIIENFILKEFFTSHNTK